ncbi:MAG: GxxExxY protein [Candidatus Berkelbacteria bacterium]|nr:GxxExxY protein [Candidatus Berkelbacteria bacterium]
METLINPTENNFNDLTEKVIGLAFKVYNNLGYGYQEKIYQQALSKELEASRINFKREKYAKILYDGEVIGKFYLDFLVENKLAIELKVRREIFPSDWTQLLNYLKAEKLKVGLLLVFSKHKVLIKRLVN